MTDNPTIYPSFNELLTAELTPEEFRAAKKKLWAIEDDYSNDRGIRKAARKVIALLNGKYKAR
jgi:hypothetical protein